MSKPSAGERSASRPARERVVSLLYEADAKEQPLEACLGQQVIPLDDLESLLASGVATRIQEIDALLASAAVGWTVKRMNSIDRAILRLAVYELGHRSDVPTAVILNEAVELAQTYSTATSGRFVNGVLASAASQLRRQPPPPSEAAADSAATGGATEAAADSAATGGASEATGGSGGAAATDLHRELLRRRPAALVLLDGEVFEGELLGFEPQGGVVTGEVVFNTAMTGYQEILTDPSYAGQIITFTYPHVGNYGTTRDDSESRAAFCRGFIVRDLVHTSGNWRSDASLAKFAALRGIPCLSGVDTRRLTRHIRSAGAMVGAFGTLSESELAAAAAAEVGTSGVDLAAAVTCPEPYFRPSIRSDGRTPWRVIVVDYGVKSSILRQLARIAEIEVVPSHTSAEEILARRPHGVLLSNGPGDPAAVVGAPETIRYLLGAVPVFGICLGHQLLATALGGETFKLPFGHHGANHPVRCLSTGEVEITSQNHNFSTTEGSMSGVEVTHVNLNDGTIEGLQSTEVPAFGVQYHPEAGPGPHDSRHLFDRLDEMISDFHRPTRGATSPTPPDAG